DSLLPLICSGFRFPVLLLILPFYFCLHSAGLESERFMHTRRSFLRTSLAATTAVLADVSSIVAKERPAVSKSPSEAYVGGVKFLIPDAPDYAVAREVYNVGILT